MLRLPILAILLLSCAAQAATVTLRLYTFGPATPTPNTWRLTAETSVGDNDGLNAYIIEHEGATRLSHNVIGQGFDASNLIRGFTIADTTDAMLFAFQNGTMPASLLYGIGNPSFAVPDPFGFVNIGMPPVGEPFGPVLLASGFGNYLAVNITTAEIAVWSAGQAATMGQFAETADVEIVVVRSNDSNPDDVDNDGVLNVDDNCLTVSNPLQIDANGDNIGNACDPDVAGPRGLGDDDCSVNFNDLAAFRAAFFGGDPNLDLSGAAGVPDGIVNFVDLNIVKDFFLGAPGPSGLPNDCD